MHSLVGDLCKCDFSSSFRTTSFAESGSGCGLATEPLAAVDAAGGAGLPAAIWQGPGPLQPSRENKSVLPGHLPEGEG